MNQWGHSLSLLSALVHVAIGAPEILRIGPRFLPASWVLIYGWLPGWGWWLWPGLYVVTGLAALLGVFCPNFLRAGLNLSALIHFIWGTVSVYGWVTNQGGTLPGSFTYWFLAGVLFVLARYVSVGVKVDRINEQAVVLEEQVAQVTETRLADEVAANGG